MAPDHPEAFSSALFKKMNPKSMQGAPCRVDFHAVTFQGLLWSHQWLKEADGGTEREERVSMIWEDLNLGAR